ncbi:MAG: hypothetical protein J5785_02610 [Spirochaetales bacterium]|nr:hypothetical protein [Spirochaetales bacterium]
MSEYYYLIPSLPSLDFSEPCPLSAEAFLAMCKGNVSDRDYANLSTLDISGGEGCTFARRWSEFYAAFRTALSDARLRRSSAASSSKEQADPQIQQCIAQALAEENPLEAELIMLKFLYAKAGEMAGLAWFDTDALFCYAVKLRILQRKDLFSAREGKAEFNRLFAGLQSVIFETNT